MTNNVTTLPVVRIERGDIDAWQPIETAPNGATPVLIYIPINRPERRILAASSTGGGEWWVCSGSIVLGKPTHWQPLPAPPSTHPSS